ncbi:MAG: hypothetical protein BM564_07635 [Bacteroidetes bacterium MedPE-SWsnd-G2]|nr:MAG: hypothetical protein BM564_07635 [Bacteroidetes bacterium MedPE-SWsnd-G2]
MKLSDSNLITSNTEIYSLSVGDLYILENVVVFEGVEGFKSDGKNLGELTQIVDYHFGKDKIYGFIANRINTYSLNVPNVVKIMDTYPNLKVYSAVFYDQITKRNLEFEKHFHNVTISLFNDVEKAISWTLKNIG